MLPPPTPIEIPEIFRLICEYLHSNKKTLASLARTCQGFHEPAIDLLWFKIEGLYPLAKCLPSDVLKETRDGNKMSLHLIHPLLLSHCLRFIHYAKRVRCFSSGSSYSGSDIVQQSVYEGLQVAMQEKLLPNVNDITWTCNKNNFRFIHMFLGPRITTIKYIYSAGSTAQTSMVAALTEKYPLLEHVDLLLLDEHVAANYIRRSNMLISDSVYKWEKLKSLKVPILNYAALMKLSQLHHLELLEITAEFGYKLDGQPPAMPTTGGFSKLATLDIMGCANALSLIPVINLLGGSPLCNFYFYFNKVETPSSWEMVFKAISRIKSIRKISCWDGNDRDSNNSDPTDMVTFEHIQPLLDFNDIEEIDIAFSNGFYISDAITTEKMAMSWRRIRVLKLEILSGCRSPNSSKPTVLDLLPFVQHCSKLETLSLPFDATSPPEIDVDNPPSGDKGYMSLVNELIVGDSPIQNPILVAAALSALFPSLCNIITIEQLESGLEVDDPDFADVGGENHRAWKEVEKLLRAFTKVRKQERKFAGS